MKGGMAALERLKNGTAVYISHSEAEKRMALFKVKIRGVIVEGGGGFVQGWVGSFYE